MEKIFCSFVRRSYRATCPWQQMQSSLTFCVSNQCTIVFVLVISSQQINFARMTFCGCAFGTPLYFLFAQHGSNKARTLYDIIYEARVENKIEADWISRKFSFLIKQLFTFRHFNHNAYYYIIVILIIIRVHRLVMLLIVVAVIAVFVMFVLRIWRVTRTLVESSLLFEYATL